MSTYEISKSSLLSLKAEVLRKQEEITKAKLQNKFKRVQAPKKLSPLEIKNKGVEARESQDSQEDEDALAISKRTLEQKSKLYDKLCKSKQNFNEEENEYIQRYLVHFDKKKYLDGDKSNCEKEEEESLKETDYEPAKNPDEEWVEYVDCLGRTRTCMRKDLEYLKSKDADFRADIENDSNKTEQLSKIEEIPVEVESKNFDENSELLSSDMRREILRKQWEEEEEELTKKDKLHYQDILFNEARTHGVGYYAFSKDEEERAKQQAELKKLRKETEEEQKKAQLMKQQREKQLKIRIKAAKNRKRARLGLPPEEEKEDDEEKETSLELDLEKRLEEEKRKREEYEKEQILKSKEEHIRPWDIGKEGVKEHYVHSQEEWVEKKRKERQDEFAPPKEYGKRSNFRSINEQKDYTEESVDSKLYFSSKKKDKRKERKKSLNPYKNSKEEIEEKNETVFEPTPIMDECSDEPEKDRLLNDYKVIVEERGSRGVEIAPPPTFEYYGPSGKPKKPKLDKHNIEEAISAGLQFLRKQSEKKNTTDKNTVDNLM